MDKAQAQKLLEKNQISKSKVYTDSLEVLKRNKGKALSPQAIAKELGIAEPKIVRHSFQAQGLKNEAQVLDHSDRNEIPVKHWLCFTKSSGRSFYGICEEGKTLKF